MKDSTTISMEQSLFFSDTHGNHTSQKPRDQVSNNNSLNRWRGLEGICIVSNKN